MEVEVEVEEEESADKSAPSWERKTERRRLVATRRGGRWSEDHACVSASADRRDDHHVKAGVRRWGGRRRSSRDSSGGGFGLTLFIVPPRDWQPPGDWQLLAATTGSNHDRKCVT